MTTPAPPQTPPLEGYQSAWLRHCALMGLLGAAPMSGETAQLVVTTLPAAQAAVAAANPAQSAEALAVFATQGHDAVRRRALARTCDPALLTEHSRPVAGNPHTPQPVLKEMMAGGVDSPVAAALALNPAVPAEWVDEQLRHNGASALFAPGKQPGAVDAAGPRFAAGRALLAIHPALATTVAADRDRSFAKAALAMPDPPREAVIVGLSGPSSTQRMHAAAQPGVSPTRLTNLARTLQDETVFAVAVLDRTAGQTGPAREQAITSAARVGSAWLDARLAQEVADLAAGHLLAFAVRSVPSDRVLDAWVGALLVERFGMAAMAALAPLGLARLTLFGTLSPLGSALRTSVAGQGAMLGSKSRLEADLRATVGAAEAGAAAGTALGTDSAAWATVLRLSQTHLVTPALAAVAAAAAG